MEQTEKPQASTSKYYRRKLMTSYFTSTLCIALVLYMAGLFFMLLLNTQHISDMFKSNIKMTVILNDQKSQADVEQFRKSLDKSDFARETIFISKDDAAKELAKELGEDFLEILGKNPLYSQIEIKLTDTYSNIDSIRGIKERLKQNKVVDEVYYPTDVLANATTVISKIASVVFILTIILLIITIILINNTVRLQMSGDRFDIRTAKLIGAPKWRIRRPYIKHSLIQGAVAILASTLGLTATISFIEKIVNGVFRISAFWPTLIGIVLIGLGITFIAALISTSKYMNAKEEELYY